MILAILILLGGMSFLVSDSYTGFSVLDSLQSDFVNKSYSADSVTLFKPSITDLGGVALSGSAYGSGHVRVFLLDSGQAYLLHEVILDDEAVDFSQACIETCGLSLSSSRYLIRYEVPIGVSYHVDEILYSEGSVENLDTETIDYEGSLETYDPYEGEEVSFDFGIQALSVSFVAPTPADAATVTEGNVDVNVSITDGASLLDLTYDWNGTNTSIYNDSLVFFGEFGSFLGSTEASSTGASGTVTGASHVSNGKYGYAYDFDGSDYITYSDSADYTYGTEFTISAWIDNHARSDYNTIAGTYNGNGFIFALHPTNNHLNLHEGSWNDNSCSPIADNTGWKHVALVRSGTSLTYYVDGEIDCTDSGISGSRDGGDLTIGEDASYEFDGLIDDVRIWDESLTQQEINQIYMADLSKTSSSTWVLSVNQTENTTDNLTDGAYTYQVFADAATTGERTVTVGEVPDVIDPNITFVSPTPASGSETFDTFVEINATIEEAALKKVDFDWNYSNVTIYDHENLMLFLPFDENTNLTDISVTDMQFTANSDPEHQSSGKHDWSYYFDDSNDYISSSWTPFDQDNFTMMGWFNFSSSGSGVYRGIVSTSGTAIDFFWKIPNTGVMQWDCAGPDTSSTGTITHDEWIHLAMSRDGDTTKFYFDGVLDSTTSLSCSMPSIGTTLYVGADGGDELRGNMDEFMIWNKTLTDQEIYEIYSSNLKKVDEDTWHFYTNKTDSSNGLLSLGTYDYQVHAEDNSSNFGSSDLRNITILSTPPNVTFVPPTLDDLENTSETTVVINATIEEDSLAELVYEWNQTNYTFLDQDKLLLYLPFDNYTNLTDLSKSDSQLTANSDPEHIVNGKYDYAYEFDDSSDYFSTSWEPFDQDNFTMMGWFNFSSSGSSSYRGISSTVGGGIDFFW